VSFLVVAATAPSGARTPEKEPDEGAGS